MADGTEKEEDKIERIRSHDAHAWAEDARNASKNKQSEEGHALTWPRCHSCRKC